MNARAVAYWRAVFKEIQRDTGHLPAHSNTPTSRSSASSIASIVVSTRATPRSNLARIVGYDLLRLACTSCALRRGVSFQLKPFAGVVGVSPRRPASTHCTTLSIHHARTASRSLTLQSSTHGSAPSGGPPSSVRTELREACRHPDKSVTYLPDCSLCGLRQCRFE